MEDGDKRQNEIDRLAKEVEKAAAAGEFVNSRGGQNHLAWLQEQISFFTNQVLSDKFINDHNGYLDARAKVSFARNMVATLTKLSNPELESTLRDRMSQAEEEAQSDAE